MTYKINGKQYWKRNGVCCTWTEGEGRKVISQEEYDKIVSDIKSQGLNKLDKKSVSKVSSPKPVINYDSLTVKELKDICKEKSIPGYYKMNKKEMVESLSKLQ